MDNNLHLVYLNIPVVLDIQFVDNHVVNHYVLCIHKFYTTHQPVIRDFCIFLTVNMDLLLPELKMNRKKRYAINKNNLSKRM